MNPNGVYTSGITFTCIGGLIERWVAIVKNITEVRRIYHFLPTIAMQIDMALDRRRYFADE